MGSFFAPETDMIFGDGVGASLVSQYGSLRLANFVTGGDRATIQDAAQLTHLAHGSFKVSDPLEWDVWDTSKLLACLVEQFGGGINFVFSDLTQCQLSN